MIYNIEINDYKCIKKLEINNLKIINIINGSNNIGKSSLLKAIEKQKDGILFLGSSKIISIEKTIENLIMELNKNKRKNIQKIIYFLNKIDPSINNIIFKNESIYFKINELKIPVSSMGDGINYYLLFLLKILNNKDSIIIIDDFENGFYYWGLEKIWKIIIELIIENKCQLFVTIHSYECLNALVDSGIKDKKNIKYMRLQEEKNKTVAKNYSYEMIEVAINNNWSC